MRQRATRIAVISLMAVLALVALFFWTEQRRDRRRFEKRESELLAERREADDRQGLALRELAALKRQLDQARTREAEADEAPLAATVEQVAQCGRRLDSLAKQVGELVTVARKLESQQDRNAATTETLASALAKMEAGLGDSLASLAAEVKVLVERSESAAALREEARQERARLAADLGSLRESVGELAAPLSSAGRAPGSGSTRDRPPRLEPVTSDVELRATVVLVDETSDVVVLGRGESDGLLEGQIFDVSRGETRIGRLQVVKVYHKMAGAEVLGVAPGETIRKGDVATSGPIAGDSRPARDEGVDDRLSDGGKKGGLPLPPPPE